MSMFSPLSKNILRGILVFSVIVLTIPIRRYEEFAGLSSELSVLLYCFGLVIGFAFMLSALALEDTRKQPVTPFPVLKNSGLAVLAAILLILVVTAVCVGKCRKLPCRIYAGEGGLFSDSLRRWSSAGFCIGCCSVLSSKVPAADG